MLKRRGLRFSQNAQRPLCPLPGLLSNDSASGTDTALGLLEPSPKAKTESVYRVI